MGASTTIVIPFHVTTDKILKVIAKVVGCAYTKETFKNYNAGKDYGTKKKFDPDLPVSDNNKWHFEFDGNKVYYEQHDKKNSSSANLIFQDINETSHSWFILLEDSQYEEVKRLSPSANATAVAVAKRLVDFFGGYTLLNDNYGEEERYYYRCQDQNKVKYPHVNIDVHENENINYRWHSFQNALDQEPILTVKELEEARIFSSYFNEKDENLLKKLKMLELHNNIVKKIENSDIKNKEGNNKVKL